MYIPRFLLFLLAIIYLLFLISVDWINQAEGAWYRPFLLGGLIVAFAGWAHRRRDQDEL